MARDRSLAVKLKADVSNYLAGIKSAGDATRDFTGKVGDSAAKHKADWATVGQSVTVAGLAIAAGVGIRRLAVRGLRPGHVGRQCRDQGQRA